MAKSCKYYKQQKQASYDNGITWYDLSEYRKGDLIEEYSQDCGSMVVTRWRTSGYTCHNYDRYEVLVEEISYDGGVTWQQTSETTERLVEANSQSCGYVPPTGSSKFVGTYSNGQTYTLPCEWYGGDIVRPEITGSTLPPHTTLTSAVINSCCKIIGYYAFEGCYSLTSVTIPDSVHSINPYSFMNCTGLTSMNIPNSVKGDYGLDAEVFVNCTSLVSCNIPSGVTRISTELFLGCSSLSSITIPAAVTLIGVTPFSGCTSLQSITCLPTTPPTMGENLDGFDGTSNCPILVPPDCVEAYKQAYNGKYASRIQPIT